MSDLESVSNYTDRIENTVRPETPEEAKQKQERMQEESKLILAADKACDAEHDIACAMADAMLAEIQNEPNQEKPKNLQS